MTSTVSVTAHCGPNKEVQVLVVDEANILDVLERVVLQDGEAVQRYVYNNRVIRVFEQDKKSV